MSEQLDAWEILLNGVKKVPKDEDVWLYLYMQKPHKGPLGKVDVDRNRDLREQVKEFLEEEGLRNFVEAKVNVRKRGDNNVISAVIHLPLKTAEKDREPNPGAAGTAVTIDASSIAQKAAELKAAKIALYGECPRCREPRPDCVCEPEEEEEDDCEKCGLPESSCLCDDTPGVLETLVAEPEVRSALGDMFRDIGHRIRYGRSKPPPDVEATNEPAPFTVHEGGKKTGGTE